MRENEEKSEEKPRKRVCEAGREGRIPNGTQNLPGIGWKRNGGREKRNEESRREENEEQMSTRREEEKPP